MKCEKIKTVYCYKPLTAWAKMGLGSLFGGIITQFICSYLLHFHSLTIILMGFVTLAVFITCAYMNYRITEREYEIMRDADTGITIEEETASILELFTSGKIDGMTFDYRMERVFTAIESGHRTVPIVPINILKHENIH